jgi:hypothetical protein
MGDRREIRTACLTHQTEQAAQRAGQSEGRHPMIPTLQQVPRLRRAAPKLIEIANDVEAAMDGRIFIERVNAPFLAAGGTADDFRAGIKRAIALGWLWRHESGTYVKFTDSGAALFA